MCRLLGYLGPPILLESVLCEPEHSLIVQSYQPREMTAGLLNADGFGVGWYHAQREANPFTYKNILPIWNDINLPNLSRYIESPCVLACIRSATAGQAVDLSNCQPFERDRLLFVHNGSIKNFRQTLYRPLRSQLSDAAYQSIQGSTDSEHIFALVVNELIKVPNLPLATALENALKILTALATAFDTSTAALDAGEIQFSANIILSDGHQLVASRFAWGMALPSLYWLQDDDRFPQSILIASEPFFAGSWQSFPAQSILCVGENLELNLHQL